MTKKPLLVEIGLEEMPAHFVENAMNELAARTAKFLDEKNVGYGEIESFATPRRLAVLIYDVEDKQQDQEKTAKGPAKKIAVDENGNWTKAAEGFARSQGITVNDLTIDVLKGEEYVYAKTFVKGAETEDFLPEIKEVIQSIPFPKNMRWGSYDLRYARPIRWLTAMYGNEVIPFEMVGVSTSNVSMGHRFLGKAATLESAADYPEALLSEYVIVRPEERKRAISNQIAEIAETNGWEIPVDHDLLDEVNQLVEYPTALYGEFDERFLAVPSQVLITTMREHQRYFPVKNQAGELLPYFVTVRNGDHRHLQNVRKGNEKVLRSRLQDSEFFYQEDLKQPLADLLPKLSAIVYHEELGTIADKVKRNMHITALIGKETGASSEEVSQAERAAELSKADLVTEMVNEFTELQGEMGEIYALKSGEDETVAQAVREHYLPKQSGDPVPETAAGAYVSAADKIDTLVTSFAIGNVPTGSQDPHGLRRQASAILQLFHQRGWTADLYQIFSAAYDSAAEETRVKRGKEDVLADLKTFTALRYKTLLMEKGVRYDIVDAVLAGETGTVPLVFKKASYLMQQIANETFKKDVEAFSRVTNIAKKSAQEDVSVNPDAFKADEEQQLFDETAKAKEKAGQALSNGEVEEAYNALASLVPIIHVYFDRIMVMTEEPDVKANRLAQMKFTADALQSFADFQAIVFHTDS
ncbi:glycine--tRNA ligase subunit beta [Salisediminibacterium halotolerans]|uniref:glycine--tRNA ligase subunit beta n=1 Tax=Salisediminibacterium halotolerans TaxID=517425 RepID=UPI000EB3C1CE|nr:glycine--tRNA ligase subunit beta [Salisediminibacterium halotolerans]RLJ78149.1 glycyl-tRNA synthetase beta chain [Actinophytocola xinjiangensis]RPE88512.1 glycyl-tRNA synthetase beta chain [Salisediminibacterium halotolerans]TWG37126.1 glycyl-tRNA synthetase beta chain [Salisediminibacterium halotolerans]GEL07264.1 glycine--tRNA ligase beta subunit [Salisediminibacterium halotolerans]